MKILIVGAGVIGTVDGARLGPAATTFQWRRTARGPGRSGGRSCSDKTLPIT